jgi:cobalt-zinc-cadmium resistance protein CzcA
VTTQAFYDRSGLVERAVGTVSKALLEAIVLVVLLLLPSSATCAPRWSSR